MTEPLAAEARQTAASARVLREVLRTPAFRQIFLNNLDAADPDAARDLIRTLLRGDPNFSLSLAAAAPRLFNALVEALLEAGRQISSFPPELLDEFTKNLAAEIDVERLRQLPALYGPLVQRTLAQRGVRLDGAAAGQAWSYSARSLNAALKANPQFLKEMFAHLDFGAVARAWWAVASAATAEIFRRGVAAVRRLFRQERGRRDV